MKEFDFGFSAVSEDELETYQKAEKRVKEVEKQLESVDSRAEEMYNAIIPLLDNLRKNPEKEIIRWPNREERINEFAEMLKEIKLRKP